MAQTSISSNLLRNFRSSCQNSEQSGCWRQIKKLTDIVPGDVIAWRKPSLKQGSTTGHVLVAACRPEIVSDDAVRIKIIDSTRNSQRQGFGTGFKTFTVNEAGEPTGYIVGKKRVTSMIAAGRMVEIANDSDFIGKTLQQAIELAKKRKIQWRIIRDKSVPKQVGCKIDTKRLNLVIENNRVVRVLRG